MSVLRYTNMDKTIEALTESARDLAERVGNVCGLLHYRLHGEGYRSDVDGQPVLSEAHRQAALKIEAELLPHREALAKLIRTIHALARLEAGDG